MAAARNLVLRASALDELSNWESGEARLAMLHGAEAWFRAAADAWRGVFDRAAEEPFRSESLLRIAEARYSIVASVVALGERLSPAEVASARTAALAMGSLAVGTRRKLAARLFIDLADRVLESKEHEFSESHGERGVEPRKEVRFEGVDDARKVVRSAVPPEVMDTVRARDDYVATVLPTDNVERTRARYALSRHEPAWTGCMQANAIAPRQASIHGCY
jgi:hypothetical protein